MIGEEDDKAERPTPRSTNPRTNSQTKRTREEVQEDAEQEQVEERAGSDDRASPSTQPDDQATEAVAQEPTAAAAPEQQEDGATPVTPETAPAPWRGMSVAIIDDAMHVPTVSQLEEKDVEAVTRVLTQDAEVLAELKELGCSDEATVDGRLTTLATAAHSGVAVALLGRASSEAARMVEEHRAFTRLRSILEDEVADVLVCDPFDALPDLSKRNLILLDYYLKGPAGGRALSVEVANTIRSQTDRVPDQQIVLMSSLETVRDARGEFRSDTKLTGSAFAFVGKPDLNEPWKVKAHLGMLERARPYAPAFTNYRAGLDSALEKARDELLGLVDDLDIGDYAFLQSRTLMKDGHPLGDYVFWLLSSQFLALAFERDEMRQRQRDLDVLELVGGPFAATEPSTIVANLLHSALVSRNMGPLAPHPRAKTDSAYSTFPVVQLGDVFLDKARTKAVVVMSADCDLAFSPVADRAPDADTPVLLLPGKPVKAKDPKNDKDSTTEGLLHREEVYRIIWNFGKYRSVSLGELRNWLEQQGFDASNRDRLRPLFGLKLQQEFGAHLMRVGPPILPPTTIGVGGKLVSSHDKSVLLDFTPADLYVTRTKDATEIRMTTKIVGALRRESDAIIGQLEERRDAAQGDRKKGEWQKKIDALTKDVENDDFWIGLLDNVELNAVGTVKTVGPFGIVIGSDWTDNKTRVILEVAEAAPAHATSKQGRQNQPPSEEPVETGSISAAA
ncbi:hypothetical protein [Sphingomonas sp. CFBP8993]|uniref:hypothetical protein n=1 Tax=Sphingomonas sp. CFBP8993 TaxID=3096526 RepID=UPI002A6AC742|nr:hypothetical protein [Sphingomonas sp. CFBP8993]